jgi:hypothetical protein
VVADGEATVTQERGVAMLWSWLSGIPTFELKLGTAKPYRLTLESGASENVLDLGGVPVTRFEVRHGAGRVEIDFSRPNPAEMTLFSISAGAGSMEAKNLGNANFAELVVEGGAAAYVLDFAGDVRRNAHVRIATGVSSVDLRLPSTTAAKVSSETVLGGLHIGDGFTKRQAAFWNAAAMADKSPLLDIRATVSVGQLRLVAA